MKYKLLIIDDDRELLKMLKSYFELKGYQIVTAQDGMEALDKIRMIPDIILLDINMPKMDGIELCRLIRNTTHCPILFLTAKSEEQDRINGLLSGGDDYIVKPFSLKELDARMTAHLKREERHTRKTSVRFHGKLSIDYLNRSVEWEGKPLELTKMEFDIIEFLSMHPGQVFDRERIYEGVCGYDGEGDDRVITELIRRIRNKLEKYTEEEWIATVWGCGYKWKK